MGERRLVGIDLGISSAHTVRVLSGDGSVVCRRKAMPTVASLGEVERAALAGTPAGTRLEVVVEPTGPAWLPIAVFFTSRGHTVYRVSSAKAHDLRRVLSRQAKSNGIDADTLERLPLVDPAGLHPWRCPPRSGRRWTVACASATGSPAGRHPDPQLARLYYVQMVQRGKDHLGAICVVAAHLAERAWTVMDRGMPYVCPM
jgi:Transposase